MSRVLSTAAVLRLTLLGGVVFCLSGRVDAASVQVGSLILPQPAFSSIVRFEPGFGALHMDPPLTTESIAGAPVNLDSDFAGTSGDTDGNLDGDDIGLRTFTSNMLVRRLGRFGGTQNAGGIRWAIDLSPLDGYLNSNSLNLTAADLQFDLTLTGDTMDVYLSYTDPAASIALAELSQTNLDVSTNWTFPANEPGVAVGDIVNGTHQVLALGGNTDTAGSLPTSVDLLPLYNSGVRELNLVFATDTGWSGTTSLSIGEGTGIYIDTEPIPEPAGLLLLGLAAGGLGCFRFRKL